MFWRIIFVFHDKPATREDKLGSARCAHEPKIHNALIFDPAHRLVAC